MKIYWIEQQYIYIESVQTTSMEMRVLKYNAKLKQYLRHENKVNENKVSSYCEALSDM